MTDTITPTLKAHLLREAKCGGERAQAAVAELAHHGLGPTGQTLSPEDSAAASPVNEPTQPAVSDSWRDDQRLTDDLICQIEMIRRDGHSEAALCTLILSLMRRGLSDEAVTEFLAQFDWARPLIEAHEEWSERVKQRRLWLRLPLLTRDHLAKNTLEFLRFGWPDLRRCRDEFVTYERGAYHSVENAQVRSAVREFLDAALVRQPRKRRTKDGESEASGFEVVPFRPFNKDVAELYHALEDNLYMANPEPPCWINGRNGPPAAECIALQNGILHAPKRRLLPPSPHFFTFNALDFDFDPAAACPKWRETLNQYWPAKDDGSPADEALLLQEIFGYLLLPWTDLQKIFVFLGAGRNGKGTVARVLARLLGQRNVTAPTMSSLSDPRFGREPLIGKLAGIVGEAAFGRGDDRVVASAFIKSVSGEDVVEIGRKFKSAWVGTLALRFLFLANTMPGFVDDSPAFGMRTIALRFSRSFADQPDTGLSDKLNGELPGILNWALEGYDRLRRNRRFTTPESSREAVADIVRLASPVAAFVQDCCIIDAGDLPKDNRAIISEDELYRSFLIWADRNSVHRVRKGEFVEAVAVVNSALVEKYRPRLSDGSRGPRSFRGIRLNDPQEPTDRLRGIM